MTYPRANRTASRVTGKVEEEEYFTVTVKVQRTIRGKATGERYTGEAVSVVVRQSSLDDGITKAIKILELERDMPSNAAASDDEEGDEID